MKKTIRIFAVLSAIIISSLSCQKEENSPVEAKTHTVCFTASQTMTKTSFEVDGSTVTYSWSENDAECDANGSLHFYVYENNSEAELVTAGLDDGIMTLTATFTGEEAPENAEYVAYFNSGVKASQHGDADEYDQYSDVLVSSAATGDPESGLQFKFRRATAFGYVKFLGLDEGEFVSSVKIESTDGTVIAAEYDFANRGFATSGSTSIDLVSTSAIDDEASFIKFVTVPNANVSLKMTVNTSYEAADDTEEPALAATYEKVLNGSLSFTAGDVRAFSVRMTKTASYGDVELAYVDLGLPSGMKWANMNLGATRPEGYGDHFAWGETVTKTNYTFDTYKWVKYGDYSKYNYPQNTILVPDDDAAHKIWGENWRIPTSDEFRELQNNCSTQWTTLGGINGILFTSDINGKSIFLPAAGSYGDEGLIKEGVNGMYSFADLCTETLSGTTYGSTYAVLINSQQVNLNYFARTNGYSIRPVWSEIPACRVGGIELDKSEATIKVGETINLTATLTTYGDDVDNTVWWESSNWDVAYVDEDTGEIEGCAEGTAIITAMSAVGGFTATCTITVSNSASTVQAIDLGLSSGLKWADMNVGASKPEDFGYYFAWGETEPKDTYSESNYTFMNDTIESDDDAANVNLGGSWRMPTQADWQELISSCDAEYTTINNMSGVKMTSKQNGNSIFLPASGYVDGSTTNYTLNCYWSSSYMIMQFVYAFQFKSGMNAQLGVESNYMGMAVRAVTP